MSTAAVAVAVPPHPKVTSRQELHRLLAGLSSGVIVAGLFNPWDRALYLSTLTKTPFLLASNWQHPYQGFGQAVIGRTLSGGLYFPLYDVFSDALRDTELSRPLSSFVAGNGAGAVSALSLNWLTAVKYQMWGSSRSFWQTASAMYHAGGTRPFVRGIRQTLYRDMSFGGVYAFCKPSSHSSFSSSSSSSPHVETQWDKAVRLSMEVSAGMIATMVSGPYNYARNCAYGTAPHLVPPTTFQSLSHLLTECRESGQPVRTLLRRLNVGWGTLRVGVGMAVGSKLYETFKEQLEVHA